MTTNNGYIKIDTALTEEQQKEVENILEDSCEFHDADGNFEIYFEELWGSIEGNLRRCIKYLKSIGKKVVDVFVETDNSFDRGIFTLEDGELEYYEGEAAVIRTVQDAQLIEELERRGYAVSKVGEPAARIQTAAGELMVSVSHDVGYPSADILFNPKGFDWIVPIVSAEVKEADGSKDVDIYIYASVCQDEPTDKRTITRKDVLEAE